MERQGAKILFNESEQATFSLPADVDVCSAIETSWEFLRAATNVDRRVDALTDSEDLSEVALRKRLMARSSELNRFAANLVGLCAPEIIENSLRDAI